MNWLASVPERWLQRILLVLVVSALASWGWLAWHNRSLMNPSAPAGLLSLAASRDGYGAKEIIDNWELLRPAAAPAEGAAGIVQQLPRSPVDHALSVAQGRFASMTLTALALSLLCAWMGMKKGAPLAGFAMAVTAWGAALLQAVENTAVLRMLLTRDPRDGEAVMASTCLMARFVVWGMMAVWLAWMWRRGTAGRRIAD